MTEEMADKLINDVYSRPYVLPRRPARRSSPSLELSVIIPVYNTQKYIKDCLDSVLGQYQRDDFEIIVVDDGSTDRTGAILDEYKKYPEVRIIHQKNGGLSNARNTGLECARGKYIFFLDSDDYLIPGYLSSMVEAAKRYDADIVQSGYQYLEKGRLQPVEIEKEKEIISEYGRMCRLPGFTCMKLYKYSLFSDVIFPEGLWFEDTIVHLILFDRCKRLAVLDQNGYIYRVNPEGISHASRKSSKCLDALWAAAYALEQRKLLGMELSQEVYRELLEHLSFFLYRRILHMDRSVIQAAFIKACVLVDKILSEEKGISLSASLPAGSRIARLERAFRERDYGIWCLYCRSV